MKVKFHIKISESQVQNRLMPSALTRRTDVFDTAAARCWAQKLLIPPLGLGSESHNLQYTNDLDRPAAGVHIMIRR
jgi:hypothetical protein